MDFYSHPCSCWRKCAK